MIDKKYCPHKISLPDLSQRTDWGAVTLQPNGVNLEFLHNMLFNQSALTSWALKEGKTIHFFTQQAPLFFHKANQITQSDDLASHLKTFRYQVSQNKKNLTKQHTLYSHLCMQSVEGMDYQQFLQNPQVQTFINTLLEHGSIKKRKTLIYRDIITQSYVNGDDILQKEVSDYQLEVKCFVETKNDTFTIMVDDLFTLFGDLAILVHPKDKRYKKHIGRKLIIPLINRSIPIFGDENVDIMLNNGIVRVNPLFSNTSLMQAKSYDLAVDSYQYWDDFGNLTIDLSALKGKNIFEFKKNIIDSLATIGNLVSKKLVTRKKPFSKLSDQELLPQITETWVLDVGAHQGVFDEWIKNNASDYQGLLSDSFFPIEKKAFFAPKLYLTQETKILNADFLKQQNIALFEALLASAYKVGLIEKSFTVDELVDFLYLLGEQGVYHLVYPLVDGSVGIEWYQEFLRKEGEELCSWIFDEVEKISRINLDEQDEIFVIDQHHLSIRFPFDIWSLDPSFLFSLSLLFTVDGRTNFFPYFRENEKYLGYYYLMLFFLYNKEAPLMLKTLPLLAKPLDISLKKTQTLLKEYGSDMLMLYSLKHSAFDSFLREIEYLYLNHIWNLYQLLYRADGENALNDKVLSKDIEIVGLESRIMLSWYQLLEEYPEVGDLRSHQRFIAKIQSFSRGPFSWFLIASKDSENEHSTLVKQFLFVQLILALSPYLPKLANCILHKIGKQETIFSLTNPFVLKKNYKIQLFFAIIETILHYKEEKNIPKHQKISLTIKANADVGTLIQSYENLLYTLCPIEKLSFLLSHQLLPSTCDVLQILDIEIGVCTETMKHISPLLMLEQEYAHKEQQIAELRSLLATLSISGFAGSSKLQEKELEMEQLKDDLSLLEIKIKRLKMERRQ